MSRSRSSALVSRSLPARPATGQRNSEALVVAILSILLSLIALYDLVLLARSVG